MSSTFHLSRGFAVIREGISLPRCCRAPGFNAACLTDDNSELKAASSVLNVGNRNNVEFALSPVEGLLRSVSGIIALFDIREHKLVIIPSEADKTSHKALRETTRT